MGTVAGYVRVSSASQSAAMQRNAIDRAATARGDTIGRWYSDTKTGATLDRPELTELRDAVRAGDVAKVYIYRLDRLTRSGICDTLDLVDELRRGGCEIVSLADGFDLAGPGAQIVLAVMAWGAQIERIAIGERRAAARLRAEENGIGWGRPKRMEEEQLIRARELQEDGRSLRSIAMALRVPLSTIARTLGVPKVPPQNWRPGPLKTRIKGGAYR